MRPSRSPSSGPARTRLEASRARGFSPFVGRADEVAHLEVALGRAVSGYGQVVGVVGPPGVGKSRLCQEAVDRWRAEGLVVAEAHCPAHGRSLPYAALLDLLRSFFGLVTGESPPTSRRRIRTRLRGLPRGLGDGLAGRAGCLGVARPQAAAARPRRGDAPRAASTFVCRLVQALGARTPIVLLLDDVQWIDAESAAFLARLVDAVGWTRTLLLLNWRSDYTVDWMRAPYCQRLDLAPLACGRHGRARPEAAWATIRRSPTCAAAINERAGGNPFFVEEIVQSLVDEGVLTRVRRALRLARPVTELRIPATVQSLVAARIDSLSEAAKHVLQAAAVIGKQFSAPLLRLTLGADVDVAPALRTLEHADLVRAEAQTADEYTFRHPLTQEIAYQTQLLEKRTRGHEAVARALEAVHAHRLGEQASLLAYHWEASGEAVRGTALAAPRRPPRHAHRGRPHPASLTSLEPVAFPAGRRDTSPMATSIVSADSHVTEHPDAYRKFAASADVDDAPHVERTDTGNDVYVIPGMRSTIPIGLIAAAGQQAGADRSLRGLVPGGWDPEARAADQDRDGVAGEILYPTVGMVLCNHPDLAYKRACMQAYNRWIAEYCGAHPDRLFGIGQTAMRTPAEGIEDLREIKALGLRGVMLPGVPGQNDYDDPIYDPFWEAAIELGLPLSFHILTDAGGLRARRAGR